MTQPAAVRLLARIATALALAAAASPALAIPPGPYNFVVDVPGSSDDVNQGNGVCADSTGHCSLHAAIQEGNFLSGAADPLGAHHITFAVPIVTLTTTLQDVRAKFTITGNLATRTVLNGNGINGCFSLTDSGDPGTGHALGADGTAITNMVIVHCNGNGISANGHGYSFTNNYIGIDPTGTLAVPNTQHGISISSSRVYSNQTNAVMQSIFNSIQGILPAQPLDNAAISFFASQLNTIMANALLGPVTIDANVISGNGQNGIEIFSENLAGVWVKGNMIGTDLTGNAAVPNGGSGIHFVGSPFGEMIGPLNVISGNVHNGIQVDAGAVAIPSFIMGNRIGLSAVNPAALIGNSESGITTDTKPDLDPTKGHLNPSGMSLVIASNVISGNKGLNNEPFPDDPNDNHGGIVVTGASAGVKIQGNIVGLAEYPPGTRLSSPIYGNFGDGIIVTVKGITIGGSGPGEGNVVAANFRHGIQIRSSSTTGTVLLGNSIGVDPALPGDLTLGNLVDGIHIDSASTSFIGAADNDPPGATDFNTVAANGRNGIKLLNGNFQNGWGHLMRRNVIYGNGVSFTGIGIDLDHVLNAPNDPSVEIMGNYTNLDQAAPVLQSAQDAGGQTSVDWTLTTHTPPGFATTYRLELFKIDAASVNAATSMTYLGESTVSTDDTGVLQGCPGGVCTTSIAGASGGSYVVMTATDITTIPDTPHGGWSTAVQCIIFSNCQVNDTSEFSNVLSSAIVPVSTTTAVTVVAPGVGNAGSAAYGVPVDVTATVTAASGPAPTGSVTIDAGGGIGCTVTLGSPVGQTSTGTCPLSPLPGVAGSVYTIKANYPGATGFAASTSDPAANGTLTVTQASTTLVITNQSPNPSFQGAAVPIVISLTPSTPGVPTGSVVVTVGGSSDTCTITLPATSCPLTFSNAGLLQTVTATYGGDANFTGDVDSVSHDVTAPGGTATTTTVLAVSPPGGSAAGASVYGQAVNVTVRVSSSSGSPDGTALVSAGGNTCTATLSASGANQSDGSCAIVSPPSPAALAPGPYTISAAYSGSASFAISAAANGTLTVAKAGTTVSITNDLSAPTNVNAAVPITVALAVTSPGTGTPTGTITVTDSADAGDSCVITLPVLNCTLTPTTVGPRVFIATYSGDANFTASNNSPGVSHQVNAGGATATSTSIATVSPGTAVFGQPVQVTVDVTAQSGVTAPTGTAMVSAGGSSCSANLTNVVATTASGTCALSPPLPVSGSAYTVSGSYGGNATFAASSSSGGGNKSVTINKAATTTAIGTHTPMPSFANAPIAVAATVTPTAPGSGVPTGTITITDGTSNCQIALPAPPGTTCNLTPTTSGVKTLTASYGGDANFLVSTSPGVSHTVSPGGSVGTTTTVSLVNPAAAVYGQTIAVTASVHATSGSAAPTGNVTMSAGGSSCIVALGPSATTTALATCSLAPPPGASGVPYTVTAGYAGTATFAASSSSGAGNGSLTIGKANTTTSVSAPANSAFGTAVIVTAIPTAVAPGAGTTTGTITVVDNAAPSVFCTITRPATQCSLTPNATGPRTFVATYGGDANFNGSSNSVSHNVSSGGLVNTTTVVTLVSPSVAVYGQPVAVTATVTAASGAVAPNGTVTITAGGSACAGALGSPVALTSKLTCVLAPPPVVTAGTIVVSAAYSGTPAFAPTTSSGLGNKTLDVNPAATTTSITGHTPSPSTLSSPVTVTVAVNAVAPGSGAPTGTVLVGDGTGDTCTITLPATSCTLVPTSIGNKTLSAAYGGDANFAASAAPGVAQNVALLTVFSGPTANPAVTATVTLSGGQAGCTLVNPAFVPVAPLQPPPGLTFPFGLFAFETAGCGVGQTINIQIVYSSPLLAGSIYYKYGPTPGGGQNAVDHWYQLPGATVIGDTVTFSITDGGIGDDDLVADGSIHDQGGPASSLGIIPTLDEWGLLLLGLVLLALGWKLARRG